MINDEVGAGRTTNEANHRAWFPGLGRAIPRLEMLNPGLGETGAIEREVFRSFPLFVTKPTFVRNSVVFLVLMPLEVAATAHKGQNPPATYDAV